MSTWIPSLLLHKLFLGSHVLGQQHGQPLFDWQCPLRSFVACSHRCPIVLCHAINQVALARRTIEFDHCIIYLSNIDTSFCVMCCPTSPSQPHCVLRSAAYKDALLTDLQASVAHLKKSKESAVEALAKDNKVSEALGVSWCYTKTLVCSWRKAKSQNITSYQI